MAVNPPTIGELRQQVLFENNTGRTVVSSGGIQDGYEPFIATRGKLVKNNGRRTSDGYELVQESTYSLWVRWQDRMEDGITMKTNVVVDNRQFAVASIEKVGQKKFYLYLGLNETSE